MLTLLKEVVGYAVKITIVVLLPIVIFTLITSRTTVFGIQSFVVLSGSMEPTVSIGSIVYTKETKAYQVKDIISYKTAGGQTVTHRIVEILRKPEGVFYRVKGDANKTADNELVPAKSVLGKAEVLILLLGYLVYFTRTLPGFIALIIVPALVFIGFEIWTIKKEIGKEIEKRVLNRIQI